MADEIELQIRGARELGAVAGRLRGAANRDLRLELYRGLRAAVAPIPAAVRRSALATLPRAGGLAALVAASKITTRRRATGADVGIRVTGSHEHDIAAMDRGRVRHPLYGNKEFWFTQPVRPGWWSTPAGETAPAARTQVVSVLERIKKQIEG